MTPLRFGILGCGRGRFAAAVAEAIPTALCVTAVCDLRIERAQRLAKQYGVPTICEQYEQMLERADVDAIVIATPDHQHAQQAIKAMEAGKHVLSEIPAAYTIDELHQIIALSARSNAKYMMGNEVRWLPALEAARQMGVDGFWGDIFYGEAEYLHNLKREEWIERLVEADGTRHWRWDPRHPQTTLLGGGPHAFDTLRWLAGETGYSEAFAYGVGQAVEGNAEPSTAICLLKTQRGTVHKITVSYAMVRPYCLYFSVYGHRGTFEGGRVDQNETFFYSDRIPHMSTLTKLGVPYWDHPGVHMATGHGTSEVFMMEEFVRAIREDRDPAIGPIETARSMAPAICAMESVRIGRPVPVPAF